MDTNFMEEQVIIHEEKALRGTLALPKIDNKKWPAVLIVNGSGSADRDEILKSHI